MGCRRWKRARGEGKLATGRATTAAGGRLWRRVAAAALVLAAGLGALIPAAAAGAEAGAAYATVELSGVVILRVRDAAGWPSVYARADEIYRRLNEAINTYQASLSPDLVRVGQVGGAVAVFIGDELVVTVDAASARLNGVAPGALARVWAANLKRAIQRFVEARQGPQSLDL